MMKKARAPAAKARNAKSKDAKAKPRPKTNPLRPSMREDKRYVAFEIISEKPLGREADRELVSKINDLLGVFHASKAGILRVKYDPEAQKGLFRVERKFVDFTRACFVMLKRINGSRVMVRTLRVSGMLHKAREAAEA